MSGQQHQFPGVFSNNQQAGLRSQFVPGQMAGGMSNQMGPGMQSQMPSHLQNISMGNQMPNQMNASINSGLGPQMTNTNTGGGMQAQMLGQLNQQYMSTGLQNNQLSQQQVQLQMQQQQMQQQLQQQQVQQVQQMQQNQQSNVQNPPATTPTPSAPAQSKEFNTVSLCRFGQETVQDIVSRTQEVFSTLRTLQPPNGTAQGSNMSNERKAKVQEQLRTIRLLFKRLRLIYEKCNESCQLQGMEYTHIESLIPLKDELDVKSDEKKTSEAYRSVCEEHKEYMEQVVLKNKQLKEVIDHLRRIIWEINTMLNMRRS